MTATDTEPLSQKQIQDFVQWVIDETDATKPSAYKKKLDAPFQQWSPADSWSMIEVAQNGIVDVPEVLNHALFNPQYAARFEENFGATVPWILTPQEERELAEDISRIDAAIVRFKTALQVDCHLSEGSTEYDKMLAALLWQFCLITPSDSTHHYLVSEELREFTSGYEYLTNSPDLFQDGLGIITIDDDAPHESTVYDLLRNKTGYCSEQAYTYFYVARRAGLDVGFGQAAIDSPGGSNHLFNVVTCGPERQTLKIDLAQGSINQKYDAEALLDLSQALAVYYSNSSSELPSKNPLSKLLMQTALELDPTNSSIMNSYAMLLNSAEQIEQAHEYYQRSLQSNPSLTYIWINAASFYETHPQFGIDFKEYYQKSYDIYLAYERSKANLDELDRTDLMGFARSAYKIGEWQKAKEVYDKAYSLDPEKLTQSADMSSYAMALAITGSSGMGLNLLQASLATPGEFSGRFGLDYLTLVDNYIPINQQQQARQFALNRFREFAPLGSAEVLSEKIDALAKTLSLPDDAFPAHETTPPALGPVDYINKFNSYLSIAREDHQTLITEFEQSPYFGSYQGFANERYAIARFNSSIDLLNQRKYLEALPALQKAFQFFPTNKPIIQELATCYAVANNTAALEAMLKRALPLVTNKDVLYHDLSLGCAEGGLLTLAIKYLKEAIRLNPNEPVYKDNLVILMKSRAASGGE